ncbi:hypothetical protein PFTANZ_01373 [Plasmodium falciparum Tanzania (2000708)]|uniref:Uncharacterized protein n=1 Tax=Plasmodium falciparum Tanzania (2000708) TaxID=1036725 RepID=A0A024WB20_PLAFA|nr:hypothetical protein PFTANZ_01373 [Plasmodium falciparum Tanzania (2000708)]
MAHYIVFFFDLLVRKIKSINCFIIYVKCIYFFIEYFEYIFNIIKEERIEIAVLFQFFLVTRYYLRTS